MTRLAAMASVLLLALGCSSSGGPSDGSFLLHGTVVDAQGAPVPGLTVFLDHAGAQVAVSAADGSFSFSGVKAPYDLGLRDAAGIREYRGLSAATVLLRAGGHASQVTLSGQVTGPAFPLPAGQAILIGTRGASSGLGRASPADGTFSVTATWMGSTTASLDLVALLVTEGPAPFSGVGPASPPAHLLVTADTPVGGLALALTEPVPSVTTTVQADFGAYQPGLGICVGQVRYAGAAFSTCGIQDPQLQLGDTIVVPAEGAALLGAGRDANGDAAFANVPVTAGTTTVTFPAAIQLAMSVPPDGATAVSRTPTLTWAPTADATEHLVTVTGGGLRLGYTLPGGTTSLTIPDYGFLGLGLQPLTTYTWHVTTLSFPPRTPEQDVTNPSGPGATGPLVRAWQYEGPTWTFTTGP